MRPCPTPAHNRRRKQAQKDHRRAVRTGSAQPRRPIPTLQTRPAPVAELPSSTMLLPVDWCADSPLPQHSHATLRVMAWSCRGRLFAYSNIINSGVRQFLHHVATTMIDRRLDVMWLNDARFTAGAFDPYLPVLLAILPNCRVFQFPTHYVDTNSRTLSYNQMGGAVAIVTHTWHGYVTKSIPDPTGSGLINAIDINIGPCAMRLLNTYIMPTTSGGGPATLLTRVQSYLHGSKAPHWAKHLSPVDYQFSYLQKLVGEARLQSRTVFITGDFNRPLARPPTTQKHNIYQWAQTNNLIAPALDTLYSQEEYYTWSNNSSTQNRTTIDHVLHSPLPPTMVQTEVGAVHDSHCNFLSDHLPIWFAVTFTVPLHFPEVHTMRPTPPRADLDMTNEHELYRYNELLTTRLQDSLSHAFLHPPTDGHYHLPVQHSSDGLAILLRQCALTVQRTSGGLGKAKKTRIATRCQAKRGPYKNGFSPQMRQLQVYLYFYQNLLRVAFAPGRRRAVWRADTYLPLLHQWVTQWRTRYKPILETIGTLSPAHLLPTPEHLAHRNFHSITRSHIVECIKQIKDQLHGTNRAEMRNLISPAIRHRQHLHATHQLGRIIQELSCQAPHQLELASLPCPERGQITDPVQIQQHLNSHMRQWYAIPDQLDPAALHLARHPHWWRTLLEPPGDDPSLLHSRSKIPPKFQKGLRCVCAEKVSQEQKEFIHARLSERITYEEFDASLNALVNGSAPGPSEVTSNMIKAWSSSTRHLVYAHMEHIWIERAAPKWFKDKVIKLAPKIPGNTELNNMRPISLYEVLRKAWTTIVAKRIHQIWHDLELLHPSQHGYRLDQGTLMALHSVIDEIEGAQHTRTTKHLTFWDIKRAFDSIPRNLQKIAWIRLGVPDDIATWFVDLDDGGLSFIDSPFYQREKSLRSTDELQEKPGHFSGRTNLAFTAERGIGQGESASSLMWTALYDILLEWIDPVNVELHHHENLHYTRTDAENTSATAYADDLATKAEGPKAEEMHQLVATWLSAFCALTGLAIHPAKVQTTTVGPAPSPEASPTPLIVHDLNWKPIECPIQTDLTTVKYLGVDLDLRGKLQTHERALTKLNTALSHLLVQAGPPSVKIDYVLFKLAPQILPTAMCANWSLQQYRALDKPLSSAYRILLALPKHFPTALLYIPKTQMGIGLKRLSDKAQVMKWEALARSQAVGGDPAYSVNAFFSRLPASASDTVDFVQSLHPPPGHQADTFTWPQRRFLVRSLIEWWHQSGLKLSRRLIDPAITDVNHSDNRSLRTLAQSLRLHPDYALYSEEDNHNLPLIRLTCTDGSFTIKPRGHFDIITAQDILNCIGTGAGGMVFLPPGYHEHIHRPPAVRITSSVPLPGMNAYAWELVTQLIALHFTAYMPSHHVLTSDCESAIARTNESLASLNDRLVNTRCGIFASGAHQFSRPLAPRKFIHTRGHPENNPDRSRNPTMRDKAICIADAVADRSKATLGGRTFPTERHSLDLRDILPELIPAEQWHLRERKSNFPVLGDVLTYQHQHLLASYAKARDLDSHDPTWSTTAYNFANTIHPVPNRSYWAAARRTTIVFDWVGHGRNRAKINRPTPTEPTPVNQCRLCGQLDSQQHCMLACPDARLIKIRSTARDKQNKIYLEVIVPNTPERFRYFAQQLLLGSWTQSPNLSRIWLGMWNLDTLRTMIKPSLTAPLTKSHRRIYLKIARRLTKPLILAYSEMLNVNMRHKAPSVTTSTRGPPVLLNVLENTFPQDATDAPPDNDTPDLNHLYALTHYDSFTLSDAASSYEYAEPPD